MSVRELSHPPPLLRDEPRKSSCPLSKRLLCALAIIICIGSVIATALLFEKLGYASIAICGGTIFITTVSACVFNKTACLFSTTTEPLSKNHAHDSIVNSLKGNDQLDEDEESDELSTESLCYLNQKREDNVFKDILAYKKGETKWFDAGERLGYFIDLALRYPELRIPINRCDEYEFICYNAPGIDDICERILQDEKLTDQHLSYEMTVGKNHSALVYVDRKIGTIEYFDSKKEYGEYKEIEEKLTEVAKRLSYTFIPKIQNILQPDFYQCGPWILYFLEKRLEDPTFDFNSLDIEEAQNEIAHFRKKVLNIVSNMALVSQEIKEKEIAEYSKHYGEEGYTIYWERCWKLPPLERWRRMCYESRLVPYIY